MQKVKAAELRLPNFEKVPNSRVLVLAQNPFNFLSFTERRLKIAPVEEFRVPPNNVNSAVDILLIEGSNLTPYAKRCLCESVKRSRRAIYNDDLVRVIFCKSDWQIAKWLKKIFPEKCRLLKVSRPK